jgi:hypothetical protein
MKKSSIFWAGALLVLFLLVPAGKLRADESEVMARLDQLTKNQEKILQSLEEIKSELNIVKIRTTLKG